MKKLNEMKTKDYPYWIYLTKKLWLRSVRARWRIFCSAQSDIRFGYCYYPKEVYQWILQFEKMDIMMKDYYKNA